MAGQGCLVECAMTIMVHFMDAQLKKNKNDRTPIALKFSKQATLYREDTGTYSILPEHEEYT